MGELALSPNLKKDEIKQALKEGLKEWMNEKYAVFGLYSIRAVGVAALGALIYFILWANGWHK